MIGILIVCHRDFGVALKDTSENIFGRSDYLYVISVFPKDGIEGTKDKIVDVLTRWKNLDGILIFVDMFGGTPCNAITKILKQYKNVDVITGVNLPIILQAIILQEKCKNIDELVLKVLEESKKTIINLKSLDIFKDKI